LTFDPTPTACLLCVDFERHLVSVGSGSGAHFDRCTYIIDLTQYWTLEYTFRRWSSQQKLRCASKNLQTQQNACWWLDNR